jgi:hypothetical protein
MKKIIIAVLIAGACGTAGAAGAQEFSALQRLGAADLGGGLQAPDPGAATPSAGQAPDLAAAGFNHNESLRCVSGGDPFEVPAYLFATPAAEGKPETLTVAGGTITGFPADERKCVDTGKYRPALKLTAQQRGAYGIGRDGMLAVANVRHLDRFYVAAIPLDAVRDLYFQVAYYRLPVIGPRGGHSQVRVLFSRPVRLVPQYPADPAGAIEVDSLIFSVQAVGTDPKLVDPLRVVDGSMLLGMGVYTVQCKLADQFREMPGVETRQYRLGLSDAEKKAYVRAYLDEAASRRLSSYFNLLTNNCNTTQFSLLGRVRPAGGGSARPYDPDSAALELEARGLIGPGDRLINFEKEEEAAAFLAGR